MVIMDMPILSILAFSAIVGLVVFLFDLIVPGLTGRQRAAMTLMDLIFFILFLAIVIFLLRAVGFWPTLIAGI